jgi:hypothetical protein
MLFVKFVISIKGLFCKKNSLITNSKPASLVFYLIWVIVCFFWFRDKLLNQLISCCITHLNVACATKRNYKDGTIQIFKLCNKVFLCFGFVRGLLVCGESVKYKESRFVIKWWVYSPLLILLTGLLFKVIFISISIIIKDHTNAFGYLFISCLRLTSPVPNKPLNIRRGLVCKRPST